MTFHSKNLDDMPSIVAKCEDFESVATKYFDMYSFPLYFFSQVFSITFNFVWLRVYFFCYILGWLDMFVDMQFT